MHRPSFLALAFQVPETDSSLWIIIIAVLVILFFIVAIVVIGLAVFFISRKRKKDQAKSAFPGTSSPSAYAPLPQSESAPVEPGFEPSPSVESYPAAAEADYLPVPSTPDGPAQPALEEEEFDPTRTVAIVREQEAVTIDYGSIKFTSGALAGERFPVDPEGVYIGRESTLSQIVLSDPRISKRHLWLGVRDGQVWIVDEGSRNGTFVNDPKSERITETTLNSGDTVIMGESDVARFEFKM